MTSSSSRHRRVSIVMADSIDADSSEFSRKRTSEPGNSRDDFWSQVINEQEQISVEYEKAMQELLSLEEPLPNVQSVVTRLHDQTQRYKIGVKRKDAEIREKEEKIDHLYRTLESFKNSITIDQKKEIEQQLLTLQKQVDVSHLREQDLQETVDYLRKQVKSLESSIERKEIEAAELDADLELMGRTREGMQKEKEKMKKIMIQTEAMVSTANAERDEYSRLYDTSKTIIDDLRKQFSEKINEAEQLTKQAAGAEQTIDDLKKNYSELVNEYDNLYDMYNDCYKQLTIHRETNQELASGLEELYKENEDLEESEKLLKRKLNIIKVRLGACERQYAQLMGDYNAQCENVEKLAKEVNTFKQGLARMEIVGAAVMEAAPAERMRQVKSPLTKEAKIDEEAITRSLEKDLRERDRKIGELNHTIESLQGEKRAMAESMAKVVTLNTDLQGQLKSQNSALKSMDQFLSDARQQWRDSKNQCELLKHEKKKVLKEKESLQNKTNDLMDIARQYEEQLMATRRELAEKVSLLKKEKNNVEIAKAERNSEHAKWQETNAILQDQKRCSKIEATQIQQLKEEVVTREKKLTKEQLAMKKLNAKLNSSIVHENKLEKRIDELRTEMSKYDVIKRKYEHAKLEDQKEKQTIMKQQAKYQKEMANISTMLDRRIAELGLLHDKVELKNSMLKRGEFQYQERMNDIRLLKIEVKRLRHHNQILQTTYKNMADLRHEIYHLNRDLATERQKCHALQEELETPINFHRWRVLEGSDPDKRDMVDKVQILQKKLIKEVENRAIEKERFKDLEQVYIQLKKKLTNLPGSDIMEELNNTKKALKDKTDENRVFAATLSAREGEVQDYKYRLDQLQQQYNELKKKNYDAKRAHDYANMRRFEAQQAAKRGEPSEGKTVLGGGFRLEERAAT